MKNMIVFLMILGLLPACSTVPRSFSPKPSITPADFSHDAFDTVLKAHVTDGVVHYPRVALDPNFTHYLRQLNQIAPTQLPTPNDRLAFWINAYNAFAIKGILDGYSPSTFTGRYQYFINQRYAVGGQSINLYDLERELLIPDFREPRIHFAIVCASQSCPQLRSWAFSADQIDDQLSDSAERFINDRAKNRFDRHKKVAYLSKIFDWFTEDFVNHSGSLGKYVAQYIRDPELAMELKREIYTIEFMDYDWSLNGVTPMPRKAPIEQTLLGGKSIDVK